MKKLFLFPIIILALNAKAQTTFGIKGGLNVSNLTNTDDLKSKVGFYAGGYAHIEISDEFAFQPELLYSSQGAKTNSKSIRVEGYYFEKVKYKLNLDYINVPLMFKYYPIEGFNIEAGPQIGFLVNSKAKIEGEYLGKKIDTKINAKDELKTVDFGLNVGLGYEFTNGLNLNARYNFGLTKVNNDDSGKVRNSVFSVGLGYSFK